MVTMETTVEDKDTFQPARNICQPNVGVQARKVPSQKRFNALKDEEQDERYRPRRGSVY